MSFRSRREKSDVQQIEEKFPLKETFLVHREHRHPKMLPLDALQSRCYTGPESMLLILLKSSLTSLPTSRC